MLAVELLFSLITFSSLMNNTTNNQGDHCIYAENDNPSFPAIDLDSNQMLSGSEDFCKDLIELLTGGSSFGIYTYELGVMQ